MDKSEFIQYIADNFYIDSSVAYRLFSNILSYVSIHAKDEKDQYNMLDELLDNTIGLSEEEIRSINLEIGG